jgi:hypothetical protein
MFYKKYGKTTSYLGKFMAVESEEPSNI